MCADAYKAIEMKVGKLCSDRTACTYRRGNMFGNEEEKEKLAVVKTITKPIFLSPTGEIHVFCA